MYQLKPLIISSLYHLKFFDILRQFQKKRVIILMYHRFSQKPEPFKIQQSVFDNQIKFLRQKYNIISLKRYSEVLNGQRDDLPDNPVIITIDDGYEDNYHYAYPVLKKYGVPATIFLTTDFITKKAWLWSNKLEYILKTTDRKSFPFPVNGQETLFKVAGFKEWHITQLSIFNYCCTIANTEKDITLDELACSLRVKVPEQVTSPFLPLSWQQIREMYTGGVEFGSHTCSHPICSRLTPKALQHELIDSKMEIEENISAPVGAFCYPNGKPSDYSDEVITYVRNASYLIAVTTTSGFNNISTDAQAPYSLKRISITTADFKKMTVRLNGG